MAANSFFVLPSSSPCSRRSDRASTDPQVVPTQQGGVDPVGVGAKACGASVGGADMGQTGLLLGAGRPLDGLAGGPPAGPVLDAGLPIEEGDLAPADAEAHVDVGGEGHPDCQGRVDGLTDSAVTALKFVTDGERGRIEGGRRSLLSNAVASRRWRRARSGNCLELTTSPMTVARGEVIRFTADI